MPSRLDWMGQTSSISTGLWIQKHSHHADHQQLSWPFQDCHINQCQLLWNSASHASKLSLYWVCLQRAEEGFLAMGQYPPPRVSFDSLWSATYTQQWTQSRFFACTVRPWTTGREVLWLIWLRSLTRNAHVACPHSTQTPLRQTMHGDRSECWLIFTKLYDQVQGHPRFSLRQYDSPWRGTHMPTSSQTRPVMDSLQIWHCQHISTTSNTPIMANQTDCHHW